MTLGIIPCMNLPRVAREEAIIIITVVLSALPVPASALRGGVVGEVGRVWGTGDAFLC